ncbi:MAG: hypothetical protein TREMPRED_000831 [Tremellales sp. Tagirdzhanova-0007]|nr:MAG: hypothetical protein TREMPRED_000831 [Tremellales sp. Tagirdzhanova-0007]
MPKSTSGEQSSMSEPTRPGTAPSSARSMLMKYFNNPSATLTRKEFDTITQGVSENDKKPWETVFMTRRQLPADYEVKIQQSYNYPQPPSQPKEKRESLPLPLPGSGSGSETASASASEWTEEEPHTPERGDDDEEEGDPWLKYYPLVHMSPTTQFLQLPSWTTDDDHKEDKLSSGSLTPENPTTPTGASPKITNVSSAP